MIIDNIRNANFYLNLGEEIDNAISFIKNLSKDTANGSYNIGESIHSNVFEVETTQKDGIFEAHKKCIDIHYVIEGTELMEYSDIDRLTVKMPYNDTDDYTLLSGEGSVLRLGRGDFCIFYPQDAHKPGCFDINSTVVKKAVIKIIL